MIEFILNGACIVEGIAAGKALVSRDDLALSLIDADTGIVRQPGHSLYGCCVAGRILVFPYGCGSSSGSYKLLHLAEKGMAPAAIVNAQADAVVAAGAVIANVPLVHRVSPNPMEVVITGDDVRVNAARGIVAVERDAT